MKRKGVEGVGDILGGMIARTRLGQHIEHALIWQHWAEIVGAELAPHCHPVTVAEMRLSIEADSAVAMHRIALIKWPIVKRINTLARKELINDVFVALLPDGDEISLEKTQQQPRAKPRGVNLRHLKHARPDDGPPAPVRRVEKRDRPRRKRGA